MISFIPRVLPHIPPRIRVVRICTFGEFMSPFVAVVVNVTMSRHPRSVVHGRLAGRTTFSRHLNAPSRPPILNSFPSLTDRPTDRPTAQCSASNQWHLWKRAAGEDGTSPLLFLGIFSQPGRRAVIFQPPDRTKSTRQSLSRIKFLTSLV